jgi:hypothetical protein
MAKAHFSLDKFRSEILTNSLARNNRFEVIINPPAFLRQYGDKVSLLAEQASLPMLNIAAKSYKIFGPSYQRPFTSEYGGEGMPITFHVDRKMSVRNFFEDWMHAIINPTKFTTAYQNQYIGTIEIRQIDEQDNITYAVKLLEAFPRNLNLMDLNHSASNQTHRLNILFAYRYWERVQESKPVDISRVITTPEVPRIDNRIKNTDTRLKNVTFTGQADTGTTNDDMAFGVGQLSG